MHIGLIQDPTKFRNINIGKNIDINGNIEEKTNSKKIEKKNSNNLIKSQIYFQWCTYTDEMKKVGLGNILIDYDVIFSDVCETIWFGDFVA
jgi:ABC-type lipopolysaccharide export system ATPase subunit